MIKKKPEFCIQNIVILYCYQGVMFYPIWREYWIAYRGKNHIFGQQSNNMWLILILFTYFSKCLIWKTVQRRRHFEKESCLMMHNCKINKSNSSEYRTNHLQHLEIVDRNFISWVMYLYITKPHLGSWV